MHLKALGPVGSLHRRAPRRRNAPPRLIEVDETATAALQTLETRQAIRARSQSRNPSAAHRLRGLLRQKPNQKPNDNFMEPMQMPILQSMSRLRGHVWRTPPIGMRSIQKFSEITLLHAVFKYYFTCALWQPSQ